MRVWCGCALSGLALLALLAAPATSIAASTPPGECPQPRFTGAAPADYLALASPVRADASLAEAEKLYLRDAAGVACAKCHGDKGDGKGPMSKLFDPPPRNFACAQTVQGIPDGQLFWIIRHGSPGTSMPPHPKLTDEQVWMLVAYLKRLAR